jgi:CRP-like cAMP-binding protein
MSIPSLPSRVSNRILSALPPEDYRRLTSEARRVTLQGGDSLYEADQPIHNVHFVLDGIGSVVTTMEEGTSVEVMIVGWEGMVGLHALEEPNATVPTAAFMQVPGSALEISAVAVRNEFHRGGKLQSLLLPYLQFALVQISQCAACNRLHDLEERLSRWLLMVNDRLRLNEFELTHEFLAQMLGTRRSSVTLAAGVLQRAGLLRYHRGRVQILNRKGLEDVACQCYPPLKRSWDYLLKPAKSGTGTREAHVKRANR